MGAAVDRGQSDGGSQRIHFFATSRFLPGAGRCRFAGGSARGAVGRMARTGATSRPEVALGRRACRAASGQYGVRIHRPCFAGEGERGEERTSPARERGRKTALGRYGGGSAARSPVRPDAASGGNDI